MQRRSCPSIASLRSTDCAFTISTGAGKQPLILLHGIARLAHTLDHLAPHFSADYHVIAVDLRGHGESTWDPHAAYCDRRSLFSRRRGRKSNRSRSHFLSPRKCVAQFRMHPHAARRFALNGRAGPA
ncbi:MAG: alpha/beta fold hydrolase [Burkholderiales bacterium]